MAADGARTSATDNQGEELLFADQAATPEAVGLETLPEKPLCHYTSQEGLIGILTQKALYATDALYLGDMQEVVYAVNLARKYFKDMRSAARPHDIQPMLNVLDQTQFLTQKLPVFVASFSEEPDLLSQWRGYCPKGSGFAVCLSAERIVKLAVKHRWSLLKCVYDEDRQFQVLSKIEQYAQTYSDEHSSPPYEIVFNLTLLRFATAFKHPKFREEAEWRAVQRAGGAVLIRRGASTLVPYINFPLTLGPPDQVQMSSVVVGPTPHMELARKATGLLLQQLGATSPIPIASEIPFRTW